jgi:hypothetical protein
MTPRPWHLGSLLADLPRLSAGGHKGRQPSVGKALDQWASGDGLVLRLAERFPIRPAIVHGSLPAVHRALSPPMTNTSRRPSLAC